MLETDNSTKECVCLLEQMFLKHERDCRWCEKYWTDAKHGNGELCEILEHRRKESQH